MNLPQPSLRFVSTQTRARRLQNLNRGRRAHAALPRLVAVRLKLAGYSARLSASAKFSAYCSRVPSGFMPICVRMARSCSRRPDRMTRVSPCEHRLSNCRRAVTPLASQRYQAQTQNEYAGRFGKLVEDIVESIGDSKEQRT
jgi:hypothetical protein